MIAKKNISELLTEVQFPRKMSTAWCASAFEELSTAVDFIETGANQFTPLQRQVWKRFKQQTAQFAEDMLLADSDENAIARRLGLDISIPANDQNQDPMVAFEQSRVADLAALYNAIAALSTAATLDQLLAQSEAVQARICKMSPTMISPDEELAFGMQMQAMRDSCRQALGH
ncbi:hypothetical protein [Pseudomonas fragariae (ex Marin et al. 2024)]|uniref:Uncharacterized protein n=2 Tax=Pseudomonas fragariae (ex Marin et al. 2024) TaxID=3080056 RepID=A0ABU5AY18_9PSED|nr:MULTISPECIES: hypothetical protein [unclassified Pseudomonas]MCW6054577.1 hypothetical protein [Pseudomonas fragi]MDV0424644.1 hypothetical protein [Pseudomonas sp. 17]MDX9570403.1 hypothetical protein [Pseudomonas sp. 21(2023)]MDX9584196.1 hypothetical protein [Pseudomonas sp. 19(2023)]MDY6476224.1 hypothetical protein [Pseudomonas sp. 18]